MILFFALCESVSSPREEGDANGILPRGPETLKLAPVGHRPAVQRPYTRLDIFPNIGIYAELPATTGVSRSGFRGGRGGGVCALCSAAQVPELRALAGTAPREKSYVGHYDPAAATSR